MDQGEGRLFDLLNQLHELTGFRFSVHSLNGQEVYAKDTRAMFCDLICNTKEGYERCYRCDKRAVDKVKNSLEPVRYRCHAGLLDIVIPVLENGQLVTIIQFGQILDDSPLLNQWHYSKQACAWHHHQDALENAFSLLPRLNEKKIEACLKIVNACVSEVRLEGLFTVKEQSDTQRLITYINTFYAKKLSLETIAKSMAISKSKLCNLASQISKGMTVGTLLTNRRMEMAQILLAQSTLSVREVAAHVGIEDYNYFTKVFKHHTGYTPSHYRRIQLYGEE